MWFHLEVGKYNRKEKAFESRTTKKCGFKSRPCQPFPSQQSASGEPEEVSPNDCSDGKTVHVPYGL